MRIIRMAGWCAGLAAFAALASLVAARRPNAGLSSADHEALKAIRGGGIRENRKCVEGAGFHCGTFVRYNNGCPPHSICSDDSGGCAQFTAQNSPCADGNAQCTQDFVMSQRACWLWPSETCTYTDFTFCGEIASGTCSYSANHQWGTHCNPDEPTSPNHWIICQSTCNVSGTMPCQVDVCQ